MDDPSEIDGEGRCVLVVEDEVLIAMELVAALIDGGFRGVGAGCIGRSCSWSARSAPLQRSWTLISSAKRSLPSLSS